MSRIEEVLSLLKSKNDYVSGEEISKRLGISREYVWKNITLLRKYGYVIEAKKGVGYRLNKLSELLLPWEIQDGLDTKFIGKKIIHRMVIDSTQDLALKIAEKVEEGCVVIAEEQTKGKGRLGREWYSPKGGIWFSLILKPKVGPTSITLLPLAIGLAISDALITLGVDARLKWPNDVMINKKKVGGILIDMNSEMDMINYVVIGIGINVNIPVDVLRVYNATSLKHELNREIDRVSLMKLLLKAIEDRYLDFLKEPIKILRDYKQRCITLNSKVKVKYGEEELEGYAIDLYEDGSLMLMTKDKSIKKVLSGDVHLINP